MTDAPDGPAESEPERGARRSRVGGGGSPVGSTLSIVLAVIAVVAGFLILRAITDDDDGDGTIAPPVENTGDGSATLPDGSTPASGAGDGTTTTTAAPVAKNAATVVVANASGIGGSAAGMTQALAGAGYTMGEPGDATGEDLATSIVYYLDGDANAQAVAGLVAADMGGLQTAAMPQPPPIEQGLGTGTVLVMVGTDTAGKVLADLNPAGAVAPPAAVGAATTAPG